MRKKKCMLHYASYSGNSQLCSQVRENLTIRPLKPFASVFQKYFAFYSGILRCGRSGKNKVFAQNVRMEVDLSFNITNNNPKT